MSTEAGKIIFAARQKKGWTQVEAAEKLGKILNQSYSSRQYQKLEDGIFPKYKKEVVEAIDKLLGTGITQMVYEQNVPQFEEPAPKYGAWDKIADSNQRLARSMEIMANLLQEKEATMKEIKASLAQIPEDMIALSSKLLEGQQHIYSLVEQVKDEVKKPHGKVPVPVKKR